MWLETFSAFWYPESQSASVITHFGEEGKAQLDLLTAGNKFSPSLDVGEAPLRSPSVFVQIEVTPCPTLMSGVVPSISVLVQQFRSRNPLCTGK